MSRVEEPIQDRSQQRHETFVPLHTTDLVEFLSQHPRLRPHEVSEFRKLANLILALLHHVYRQRHEQLTYLYAPLDPDRDTLLMSVPLAQQREQLCQEMLKRLDDVLRRANYHKLGEAEIQTAIDAASRWGVRMSIDFSSLGAIEVYARGNVSAEKAFRSWRYLFRTRTVDVRLYQRLVVIFRTSPNSRDPRFEWRRLYLRMFKNIPQQDVDMVLPATKVRFTWLDHSSIVLPSVYALVMALWRALRYVLLLAVAGVLKTAALAILVVVAIIYGIKSAFTSTINTRRRYYLNVAQNLYYQSLDNNAGAMLRLLEEGEQQEACESVLAWFAAAIMLRSSGNLDCSLEQGTGDGHGASLESSQPGPGDVTLSQIDSICEALILEATGVTVNFDVEGAVRDLVHLGLMRATGDRWQALDLGQANKVLNQTWDQWFNE